MSINCLYINGEASAKTYDNLNILNNVKSTIVIEKEIERKLETFEILSLRSLEKKKTINLIKKKYLFSNYLLRL